MLLLGLLATLRIAILVLLAVTLVFAQKSIKLTRPGKGVTLSSGAVDKVEWTTVGVLPEETIGIEVWDARDWLKLGGFSIIDRADQILGTYQAKNTGSFEFFVPVLDKTDESFYIVVYLLSDRQVNSQSEQFTIKALSQTVYVTAPNPASAFKTGEPVFISWQTYNIPEQSTMRIILKKQKDGVGAKLASWISVDSTIDVVVVGDVPNTGNHTWVVPLSIVPGPNYFFQVIWTMGSLRASSQLVTATAGDLSLSVTLPRAGLVWYLSGTKKTVEWTTTGFTDGSPFDVALFNVRNGLSMLHATLTARATTKRVYVELPSNTGNGLYFVRVTSSDSPLLFAESDSFNIEYTGDSGTYKGEQNNLLTKDYEAVSSASSLCITVAVNILIIALSL